MARVTPEDIINSKKQAFQQKIVNYSPDSIKKLNSVSTAIEDINRKNTEKLEQIMLNQGLILDEFQNRFGDKAGDDIEKARYWITFAHEAVAYQAAKIYVFNLTNESNLKSDALATINLFQSELNYARGQVIKSQQILASILR